MVWILANRQNGLLNIRLDGGNGDGGSAAAAWFPQHSI